MHNQGVPAVRQEVMTVTIGLKQPS